GGSVGKKTVALITDMDRPLGRAIGNSLEIMEVISTLKGEGPKDLEELCLTLAANMIYLGEQANTLADAQKMAVAAMGSGAALEKLSAMVFAQGGDPLYIQEPSRFCLSKIRYDVKAPETGFLQKFNAESCGIAAMVLGAGRETKESIIDFGAGILLEKNVGDAVRQGEVLATLYADSTEKCKAAEKILLAALTLGRDVHEAHPLIYKRIEK
ncbi:MAG: thymidine phosphorylase, partial [Oscillospiraceae bacterium]